MSSSQYKLRGAEYRPDIDGLRAIAVFAVLAFHVFPETFKSGFIGVDIFFVISGFLISTILFKSFEQGTFSFAQFYRRRIKRIFPALCLVLATSLVIGWFGLFAAEYKLLGKHIAAGAGFVSNIVLLGEAGYFDVATESKPLLHLWSLSVEEQFYILWPLLLWCLWKLKLSFLKLTLFFTVLSFILNVVGVQQNSAATFFSPLTRFWELWSGSLLAWIILKRKSEASIVSSDLFSALGILFFSLAFWKIDEGLGFPGFLAILPVMGTVFFILAGPHAWVNRNLLSHRILVWVGLLSYPLYLWHWPLLSFTKIIYGEEMSSTVGMLMIALSVLLAWLTYLFVERPIRSGNLKNDWSVKCLVAFMFCLGTLGLVIYLKDGFVSRFEGNLRALHEVPNFGPKLFRVERSCSKFPSSKHLEFCEEQQRPMIFIMGDSHARSLYPGLNSLQRENLFGISTASGNCNVPLLLKGKVEYPWCDSHAKRLSFNRYALKEIARIKPEIVLLHARWASEYNHLESEQTLKELRKIVSRISTQSPDSKVIVLGPVPHWKSSPMKALLKNARLTGRVNERLKFAVLSEVGDWDTWMESEASKLGVRYISAYRMLCNDEGCLARVGDSVSDVIARDYGHLSPSGASYVAQKLRGPLFDLLEIKPEKRP